MYLPCRTWCYTVKSEASLNSPALLPSGLELFILDHACEPADHFVLLWEPHKGTSRKRTEEKRKQRMGGSQTGEVLTN